MEGSHTHGGAEGDTVIVAPQAAPGSDTAAIAQTAATAATAEVIAETAQETAEEAEQLAEQVAEEQESQWTLTQTMYSDCMSRLETIEGQVAALTAPPQADNQPGLFETPPNLEMQVAEPAKQERRAISTRSRKIKLF